MLMILPCHNPLDLYRKYKDEEMIVPTLARTEWIINHPSKGSFKLVEGDLKTLEQWTWCDALFMAPLYMPNCIC